MGSPTPSCHGPPQPVDMLILGAGWTSKFLIPLLHSEQITYAATTTTGRDGTIRFRFDAGSDDLDPYRSLPRAKVVLIVFPLKGAGQSKKLLGLYRRVHGAKNDWIQLGSTGIFTCQGWCGDRGEYDRGNERAVAEDELLAMGGVVMNLAGLWGEGHGAGGDRDARNLVARVARTKEQVRGKGAVHLVNGVDVARGIVGVYRRQQQRVEEGAKQDTAHRGVGVAGRRFIVTDMRVYDWWFLIMNWADEVRRRVADKEGEDEAQRLQYETWVGELMREEGVRALPREKSEVGRRLDGRAFWEEIGIWPSVGVLM